MPTRRFPLPDDLPSASPAGWHRSALQWMGGREVLSRALAGSVSSKGTPSEGLPSEGLPSEGLPSEGLHSDLGWVKAVEAGLPPEAVESAVEQGVLSWNDVQELVLPRRTFSHRKERSEPLTPEESDRLLRLLRAVAKAEETFQSSEKARRWLRKSNRALGGSSPFEMLKTASGARLVEQVLGRIAHGIYS